MLLLLFRSNLNADIFCQGGCAKSWLYLERVEEELEKEVDVAEDAIRVILCQHCKDHFMDPQQRDQGQGGFGQSGEKE